MNEYKKANIDNETHITKVNKHPKEIDTTKVEDKIRKELDTNPRYKDIDQRRKDSLTYNTMMRLGWRPVKNVTPAPEHNKLNSTKYNSIDFDYITDSDRDLCKELFRSLFKEI